MDRRLDLLVTKSLCNVYTLNVDSVDILMSSMVDGGGVTVLYGSAIRRNRFFLFE